MTRFKINQHNINDPYLQDLIQRTLPDTDVNGWHRPSFESLEVQVSERDLLRALDRDGNGRLGLTDLERAEDLFFPATQDFCDSQNSNCWRVRHFQNSAESLSIRRSFYEAYQKSFSLFFEPDLVREILLSPGPNTSDETVGDLWYSFERNLSDLARDVERDSRIFDRDLVRVYMRAVDDLRNSYVRFQFERYRLPSPELRLQTISRKVFSRVFESMDSWVAGRFHDNSSPPDLRSLAEQIDSLQGIFTEFHFDRLMHFPVQAVIQKVVRYISESSDANRVQSIDRFPVFDRALIPQSRESILPGIQHRHDITQILLRAARQMANTGDMDRVGEVLFWVKIFDAESGYDQLRGAVFDQTARRYIAMPRHRPMDYQGWCDVLGITPQRDVQLAAEYRALRNETLLLPSTIHDENISNTPDNPSHINYRTRKLFRFGCHYSRYYDENQHTLRTFFAPETVLSPQDIRRQLVRARTNFPFDVDGSSAFFGGAGEDGLAISPAEMFFERIEYHLLSAEYGDESSANISNRFQEVIRTQQIEGYSLTAHYRSSAEQNRIHETMLRMMNGKNRHAGRFQPLQATYESMMRLFEIQNPRVPSWNN